MSERISLTRIIAIHWYGFRQIFDVDENGSKFRYLFSGDIGRGGDDILRDPQPVEDVDYLQVESTYGSIQASWAVRNGEIVMEQTLEIRDMVAPASDFAQVRDFFDKVAGVESAPVVLVRQ